MAGCCSPGMWHSSPAFCRSTPPPAPPARPPTSWRRPHGSFWTPCCAGWSVSVTTTTTSSRTRPRYTLSTRWRGSMTSLMTRCATQCVDSHAMSSTTLSTINISIRFIIARRHYHVCMLSCRKSRNSIMRINCRKILVGHWVTASGQGYRVFQLEARECRCWATSEI